MAVENAAHCVGNRLVVIVAVDEHCEERRDGALLALTSRSCTLKQFRQLSKHGRRIALRRRRLTDAQTNLALRHRKASHGIHEQQNVFAFVAEVLSDRARHVRREAAAGGAFVRGRDHDHRTPAALFAQRILNEFLHFAATLANQADHDDIGVGAARQHRHQHRFADTRARKHAHALTAAERGEDIDRAHANIEAPANARAIVSGRRRRTDRSRLHAVWQRPLAVDWIAEAIDDSTKPCLRWARHRRCAFEHHTCAWADRFDRVIRRDERAISTEPYDLSTHGCVAVNRHARAERKRFDRAGNFNECARQTRHAPFEAARVECMNLFSKLRKK